VQSFAHDPAISIANFIYPVRICSKRKVTAIGSIKWPLREQNTFRPTNGVPRHLLIVKHKLATSVVRKYKVTVPLNTRVVVQFQTEPIPRKLTLSTMPSRVLNQQSGGGKVPTKDLNGTD
jgi:hypothetical protein